MPIFPIRVKTPIGVRYLDWSTIVDAPRSAGMTWHQFVAHMDGEGRGRLTGDKRWDTRIKRMKRDGVGSLDAGYTSIESVISGNRAGRDETELTLDQIIDCWCVRQCEGERPLGTRGMVEEATNDRRVAIVFDGHKWHVRRVASLVHDLDRDIKIYTCDMPIANDLETPGEAVSQAMNWLDHYP